MTIGATTAALTISVASSDADDTLGLVTISGLPSGFSLNEGTDQGGGTWTEPTSNLPSRAIMAPSTDTVSMVTLGGPPTPWENGSTATSGPVVQGKTLPAPS